MEGACCLSETLSQIQYRDDLAAQVDDAFHVLGRIRHSRDLGHANDFMQGCDGHAVCLASHLEAHDLCFPAHSGSYRPPAAACRAVPREVGEPSPGRSEKLSIDPSKSRDIFDICSAEAASSVEPEVEFCTSSRIRSMALTTACAPDACSSTAELISCVSSFRRVVARAICDEPCDCSLVAAPISCANL